MTDESDKTIDFKTVLLSILSAIVVAIIGGYFTVKASIGAIELANKTNTEIADKNITALHDTVSSSNDSNKEIARLNNEALIASVKVSNSNSIEAIKQHFESSIKQIEKQYELDSKKRAAQIENDKIKDLNFLLSDIHSRIQNIYTAISIYNGEREVFLKIFSDTKPKTIEEHLAFINSFQASVLISTIKRKRDINPIFFFP